MIVRIVKMTFDPEKVGDFEKIFDSTKDRIRGFEGCEHLELLHSIDQPNIYFTYSYWKGPEFLETYRKSHLFDGVWSETKKLFVARPEAWSVEQKVILE